MVDHLLKPFDQITFRKFNTGFWKPHSWYVEPSKKVCSGFRCNLFIRVKWIVVFISPLRCTRGKLFVRRRGRWRYLRKPSKRLKVLVNKRWKKVVRYKRKFRVRYGRRRCRIKIQRGRIRIKLRRRWKKIKRRKRGYRRRRRRRIIRRRRRRRRRIRRRRRRTKRRRRRYLRRRRQRRRRLRRKYRRQRRRRIRRRRRKRKLWRGGRRRGSRRRRYAVRFWYGRKWRTVFRRRGYLRFRTRKGIRKIRWKHLCNIKSNINFMGGWYKRSFMEVLSPRIQGAEYKARQIYVLYKWIFIRFLFKSSVPENKPSSVHPLPQNHLSLVARWRGLGTRYSLIQRCFPFRNVQWWITY